MTDARRLVDRLPACGDDAGAFVDALCGRLVDAGIPLLRAATSLLTKHPELFVRNLVWPLVMTAAFARAAAVEAVSLGAHALKGVREPMELLGLPGIGG